MEDNMEQQHRQFLTLSTGDNMRDAFWRAIRRAVQEHGYDGFTGTVAEKPFAWEVPHSLTAGAAVKMAQGMLDRQPYNDPDHPVAGCVQLSKGCWVFFGTAPYRQKG